MKVKEALNMAKAEKNEGPLYEISFGYSTKFILPYKAMLQMVDALSQAEFFVDTYGNKDRIRPIEDHDFNMKIMERGRYYQIKAANLLGVSMEEFQEALENAA